MLLVRIPSIKWHTNFSNWKLFFRNAGDDEIKRAYKKRALIHHPDRHANASETERKEQEKKFKELGEAYGILSDPKKKARYDNGQDMDDFDGGMSGKYRTLTSIGNNYFYSFSLFRYRPYPGVSVVLQRRPWPTIRLWRWLPRRVCLPIRLESSFISNNCTFRIFF